MTKFILIGLILVLQGGVTLAGPLPDLEDKKAQVQGSINHSFQQNTPMNRQFLNQERPPLDESGVDDCMTIILRTKEEKEAQEEKKRVGAPEEENFDETAYYTVYSFSDLNENSEEARDAALEEKREGLCPGKDQSRSEDSREEAVTFSDLNERSYQKKAIKNYHGKKALQPDSCKKTKSVKEPAGQENEIYLSIVYKEGQFSENGDERPEKKKGIINSSLYESEYVEKTEGDEEFSGSERNDPEGMNENPEIKKRRVFGHFSDDEDQEAEKSLATEGNTRKKTGKLASVNRNQESHEDNTFRQEQPQHKRKKEQDLMIQSDQEENESFHQEGLTQVGGSDDEEEQQEQMRVRRYKILEEEGILAFNREPQINYPYEPSYGLGYGSPYGLGRSSFLNRNGLHNRLPLPRYSFNHPELLQENFRLRAFQEEAREVPQNFMFRTTEKVVGFAARIIFGPVLEWMLNKYM